MRTSESLVLFGAGGHAKVVFDAWQAAGSELSNLLVVDENPALRGAHFFGFSVQGAQACEAVASFRFHVGIGNNELRRGVSERLERLGGVPVTVVHPGARASRHAHLAEGAFLAAGCIVAPDSRVGKAVIVNHGAVIDHDCVVGHYSHIAPRVTLGGNVRIGEGVLVGAGAVILPGVSIGDGATIGAGAVVIEDAPAGATMVGVPGRLLEKEMKP